MDCLTLEIQWPNGKKSFVKQGDDWFHEARKVGIEIPSGCLTGSCGACEIEVNGKVIRACINEVESIKTRKLSVDFAYGPYW